MISSVGFLWDDCLSREDIPIQEGAAGKNPAACWLHLDSRNSLAESGGRRDKINWVWVGTPIVILCQYKHLTLGSNFNREPVERCYDCCNVVKFPGCLEKEHDSNSGNEFPDFAILMILYLKDQSRFTRYFCFHVLHQHWVERSALCSCAVEKK